MLNLDAYRLRTDSHEARSKVNKKPSAILPHTICSVPWAKQIMADMGARISAGKHAGDDHLGQVNSCRFICTNPER